MNFFVVHYTKCKGTHILPLTKKEHLCEIRLKKVGRGSIGPVHLNIYYMSQQNLFPLDYMQLESLPKMNRRVQSDTTSILVRQLICLLNP